MTSWLVPLRVEGPGVGETLSREAGSATLRVAEPELATATWEFEVEADDYDGAKSSALDSLRADIGEEPFKALFKDVHDWNATPRALQAPQTDRKEAKGGG